jgi:hypothetical protein
MTTSVSEIILLLFEATGSKQEFIEKVFALETTRTFTKDQLEHIWYAMNLLYVKLGGK